MINTKSTAIYHLPGLFEFLEFYEIFLPLFFKHREYFYDWCEIGSIYGAPENCLWGGGRTGEGKADAHQVIKLLEKYNISGRLTFSNSLLKEQHLNNKKCNELCSLFSKSKNQHGVIVHSDLLVAYLLQKYPELYLVSSTTKVITDFNLLVLELNRKEFSYVVPDFRFNHDFEKLCKLTSEQKNKVEFLCNECCWFNCQDRKNCYENVSRKNLGEQVIDHKCKAPESAGGYKFSKAMENPAFISIEDIQKIFLPAGFANFKIEGRNLGSAMLLEFILYYMTKPEHQLKVREEIYLDSMLDLF